MTLQPSAVTFTNVDETQATSSIADHQVGESQGSIKVKNLLGKDRQPKKKLVVNRKNNAKIRLSSDLRSANNSLKPPKVPSLERSRKDSP